MKGHPSLAGLVVCLVFAGCGGGGGGGGGAASLQGTINDSNATGIQGVVVRVESAASSAEATTDVDGNFIVQRPPTGLVSLHIEGENAPGGTFPNLEIPITIGGGVNNLSQPIVLPDLASGATLAVAVDGNGRTMGDQTLIAPNGASLEIADMTTITVGGAIPPGTVSINITPVEPINVPMPLPGSQDAGAFVTIQPPGAAFVPPLGIRLPNTRNLPVGTEVDIWSFDHDLATWVNRSAPPPDGTGNKGTVVDLGGGMTEIQADGVITEGGWHAGVMPVDPCCATTMSGQVLAQGSATPIRDVLISLSTGQFAHTDANGRFSIALVPAYDASSPPQAPPCVALDCTPSDVMLRALAPVSFGAASVSGNVVADLGATIVNGGTTEIPPIDIPATDTGSVVGSVTDSAGQPAVGFVSITGADSGDVATDDDGQYFVASLAPGPYTATFSFDSGDRSTNFTVVAHQTSVANIREGGGPPPGQQLTVKVLTFESDLSNGVPLADAMLTLVPNGSAPMPGITDGTGTFVFQSVPNVPCTVTAQKDIPVPPNGTNRIAATVIGANPTTAPRTIVIPILGDPFAGTVTTDATLDVTILNPPAGADFFFEIDGTNFNTGGPIAGNSFQANVPSGLPLDVAVSATDPTTGVTLSAVLLTLTATPGANARNFDFANACQFDDPTPVTYTNVQTQHDFFSASLNVRGAGELFFELNDDILQLPASVNLPDLSSAKLAGFDVFFEAGSERDAEPFADTSCDVPLGHATPASVPVGFLAAPTIQSPAHNSVFPAYGPGNTVQLALGSGNGVASGLNVAVFFGVSGEDLFLFWQIIAPPTATAITLPPVAPTKPMFPNGFYFLDVAKLRFAFPNFDYATFFDQNFPSNFAAVNEVGTCSGSQSVSFLVGAPPLSVDPRDRAGLLGRARPLGSLGLH